MQKLCWPGDKAWTVVHMSFIELRTSESPECCLHEVPSRSVFMNMLTLLNCQGKLEKISKNAIILILKMGLEKKEVLEKIFLFLFFFLFLFSLGYCSHRE